MTTFINLESYLECCQYANLFGEDSSKLIPAQTALPLAYREFCKKHISESFLPLPTVASAQPDSLAPRATPLPHQNIGLSLNDHRSEHIFIVREANSLVLRSLQSRYLYANVYRYWNYAQQLEKYTTSNKPLVIYDLDSFTPAQITPLTFESYSNSPFPIPIIDTRSIRKYDALSLSQSYEEIYNKICSEIASKIAEELNFDHQDLTEIITCIKKTNIFYNLDLEYTLCSYLPLILKVSHKFYIYKLNKEDLEKITYRNLPLSALQKVIRNHSDYNFVLIGGYTRLPETRKKLQQQYQNNLFIPEKANDFSNIWQQKIKNNFALYGQHLDCISFFVKSRSAGEDIRIELPQRICYEGEQEVIVYGQYQKDGKLQEEFSLKTQSVTLPFQINNEPFLDSETNKEQTYKIENQYFDETPALDVRIRFRIKPSLAPKLEVLDKHQHVLNSSLVDSEQRKLQVIETLGFIPMDQILKFRTEKSIKGLEKLSQSGFKDEIESFSKVICGSKGPNYINGVADRIVKFRNVWRDQLPSILVVPDQPSLTSILESYKQIDKSLRDTLQQLTPARTSSQNIRQTRLRAYSDLLLILGDSYKLTNDMNLGFLFNQDTLCRPSREVISWDIQLRSAAKVSCSKLRQNLFLSLFENPTRRNETNFYKIDVYIWGHARLLLWYININDDSLLKTYERHFGILVNYCSSLNANLPRDKGYLRDALISLIYILTFREIDPLFIEKDSSSYNQSKFLCKKLKQTPILSRRANLDVPLNDFFEQLLDRSATQELVSNMIEID